MHTLLLVLLGGCIVPVWDAEEKDFCTWLVEAPCADGEPSCVPIRCDSGCSPGGAAVWVTREHLDLAESECRGGHWTEREWTEQTCADEEGSRAVFCLVREYI